MISLLVLALSLNAQAHSGRTDSAGCHAGSLPYHCHNDAYYKKPPEYSFYDCSGLVIEPVSMCDCRDEYQCAECLSIENKTKSLKLVRVEYFPAIDKPEDYPKGLSSGITSVIKVFPGQYELYFPHTYYEVRGVFSYSCK